MVIRLVIEMQVIPTKLTKKLEVEMDAIVSEGWYASRSEFMRDAVRELIKKMKAERMETAIKEDIQWGLHG
jgi:Arc/MetJ-type ribon-helix-helix transcriptional regulator